MFCAVQKPYLLILANLQSNKRLKKEMLLDKILYSIFLLHASLWTCNFPFLQKISNVVHIFRLSWSIILYKELKNVGLFCQVTA